MFSPDPMQENVYGVAITDTATTCIREPGGSAIINECYNIIAIGG